MERRRGLPSVSWILVLFGAALLGVPAVAQAGEDVTFYVRTSGSDAGNGRSPAAAFRTIQHAVSRCTSNGDTYTIYVGPGAYPESVTIEEGVVADGQKPKPNRIIGDVTGALTGDTAGEVVIHGGGTRSTGLRVAEVKHWEVSYLTFRHQTNYGVRVIDAPGFVLHDCTIRPPTYGVHSVSSDVRFDRNSFEREAGTGSCIFALANGNGDISVSRSRMSMTGSGYLSTGFGTQAMSFWWNEGFASQPTFGIFVAAQPGRRNDISVTNNVLSDLQIGVFVRSIGNGGSDTLISGNTLSGCTYPVYLTLVGAGSAVVRNTIVSGCYYPVAGLAPEAEVEGLLMHSIADGSASPAGMQLVTPVVTGDPRFNAPELGDFSLKSGSPALDAGVSDSAVSIDIAGTLRPLDGNHDGVPAMDLGAFESTPRRSLRITRAVESQPTPVGQRSSTAAQPSTAITSTTTVTGTVSNLLRQLFPGN